MICIFGLRNARRVDRWSEGGLQSEIAVSLSDLKVHAPHDGANLAYLSLNPRFRSIPGERLNLVHPHPDVRVLRTAAVRELAGRLQ